MKRSNPPPMANIGQTMFRFAGALLLAGGATRFDHPSSRVAMAPVVIAAADIAQGRLIDRSSVTVAMWPAPTIPAQAYASIDSVVSRVARINVFKGEPIVPGRLAPTGARAGMEVRITPGKRAYSIRVSDMSGIVGLVRPNSRVDVLIVAEDPTRPGRRTASVVAEDLRVLALNVRRERRSDSTQVRVPVVTLEVTPEEAELLATGVVQGELQLMLRGRGDGGSVSSTRRRVESARALR